MKEFFPLGTVVSLKDSEKRLMIVGRLQELPSGPAYDYSAVLWPEGMISSDQMYLFNQNSIARVWFIGFQDSEEFAFRSALDAENERLARV